MAIEECEGSGPGGGLTPQPVVRTPVESRRHRVHAFAGRAHDVMDDLLGADGAAFCSVAELSPTETREAIVELTSLQARVEALKCRLLDHGAVTQMHVVPDPDDGPQTLPVPAMSPAAWYAGATRKPIRDAKASVRLAKRLEDSFHSTARALGAGQVTAEQAAVIVDAVDALPDFVLEHERREAEQHLLEKAALFDHLVLKKLGRHLLHVIDPDGADERLAKQLEREEERAAQKTYFHLRRDGSGGVRGEFLIPELQAAMLETALNAIASPKRPEPLEREITAADGTVQPKPNATLLGEAFCELLERYPADCLPQVGGINASVVVTMTLESLLGGIKAASVDTGIHISAAQARRLASQCGVIPAVLGSRSEVLDLGRKVRAFTRAQRTALRVRHQTCSVESCTIPGAFCHAHHKDPWSRGGRSDLENGTLLCPRHHRAAHLPGYAASYDGGVTRIAKVVRRRQ